MIPWNGQCVSSDLWIAGSTVRDYRAADVARVLFPVLSGGDAGRGLFLADWRVLPAAVAAERWRRNWRRWCWRGRSSRSRSPRRHPGGSKSAPRLSGDPLRSTMTGGGVGVPVRAGGHGRVGLGGGVGSGVGVPVCAHRGGGFGVSVGGGSVPPVCLLAVSAAASLGFVGVGDV